MKIGIIVGSTRDGRVGKGVGDWVAAQAEGRDQDYTLIDLLEFDLPFFTGDTPSMALNKQYEDEKVTAWSKAIDACDGFIFVTPEYNHSIPGAFKNAVDHLGSEWSGKPVAFVSYGASGGVRATEHWRQIMLNFSSKVLRSAVEFSLFTDFGENGFAPSERAEGEIADLFDKVEAAL